MASYKWFYWGEGRTMTMAYSSWRRGGLPLTMILPHRGHAQSSISRPSGMNGARSTAKLAMSSLRWSPSGKIGEAGELVWRRIGSAAREPEWEEAPSVWLCTTAEGFRGKALFLIDSSFSRLGFSNCCLFLGYQQTLGQLLVKQNLNLCPNLK